MVKVRQFEGRNGPVRNQFIIEEDTERGVVISFQSYDTIIAQKGPHESGVGRQITLDENSWDYSMTTGRYRNLFLGENKAETERKIKAGVYKLANLN